MQKYLHLIVEEIQSAAEHAVRDMLKTIHTTTHGAPLHATDYMDDGTRIQLKVTIDPSTGGAIFDFTGTGPEAFGNWNAPIAITNSAIIFSLRCLVNTDIPLNQGAIRPITTIIPPNSLLHPSPEAAVCAGNVLTSQRIVDVVFRAFGACAASQGCMNNLTLARTTRRTGGGTTRRYAGVVGRAVVAGHRGRAYQYDEYADYGSGDPGAA
ncbi:Uncharacterized protein LSUB1_G005910, partial [Lachnellula subtilissima]